MKRKLSLGFVFIILLVGGVFAQVATQGNGFSQGQNSFSSSNVQRSSPGFSTYQRSVTDTDFFGLDPRTSFQICQERQDFIIQIAPSGCTPGVVRSDLLAEQNVPVFCQLQAIQVNPTIDTSSIQNIVLTPTQTLIVSLQVRVPDNIDLDTYTGNMFISDLGNNVVLSTIPLIIKIEPEICSDGIVGNLRLTINNPDKGDDSKIGDEISIETEVENKENKDMDVIVEAVLYDLDRAKKILTVESDSMEVEKNSKEDIDFTMIVPNDEDIDPDNTYILYIKAYEDGDEEVNCIYKSVEVDLERDDDDVIISSFIINPTIVSQGEMVSFRVEAENIGTDEQKDSYIILRNTELNLNLKSNLFTLKKYDKSGKDYIITQTFTVPADAVAKDYTIEAVVYYNNGRDSKNSFGTLTVQAKTAEGTETVETTGTQGTTPTTGAGTFQPTGASIFDKLGDTKTLFIIGDIVLVILAVLFLVLIFKKR